MQIYVVQQGDSILSIAERSGITVEKLIIDNGLVYPFNLVMGQTIVLAYPKETHIVQAGDSLYSIAELYNVSIYQILRNNPLLSEREFLYEGESLIISYNTTGSMTTNGFAYPYIRKETLKKILPNLTYLTIFNYTTTEKGEIKSYQDDSDIIKISKEYDVAPLLMLTTLTPQGEPDIETAYSILLNEEYQKSNIDQFMDIIKEKGYKGVNIVFNSLNVSNQTLYLNFVKRVAERLQLENYLFFITINYEIKEEDENIILEQIDYSQFSFYTDGLIFLKFVWGTNYGSPSPVSNIKYIKSIINYVIENVPGEKIIIGNPTIGYDWQLPYLSGKSFATSLAINSVLELAYNANSVIQFDESSQTPFFYYEQFNISIPAQHIVWFIDARSLEALNDLIKFYELSGSGIWNVMIEYPQLWTIINAQFDIIKL